MWRVSDASRRDRGADALGYLPTVRRQLWARGQGRLTVIFRMTCADGREIFVETTLRMLGLAIDGMRSGYGKEDNCD